MKSPLRRSLLWIGVLATGAFAVLHGPGVRADDGKSGKAPSATWVYDVRVVRVDAAEPSVVESAPTWKQAGSAGATTTAPWAELLAGLKARGRATVLFDQRLTSIEGEVTEFRQQRKRMVVSLANRSGNAGSAGTELWNSTYVETGTKGELVARGDGLSYGLEVSWEEAPRPDGAGTLGNVSWKGSRGALPSGETLVLSHRQQQIMEAALQQGLEIYVFITGTLVLGR